MTTLGLRDLGFLGASGGTPDPYRSNRSLVLHGNGLNNGTSIVDSSLSSKTITRSGAVTSTVQSKFGGSSIFFSSSFLSIPDSSDFYLSGDFTIEGWFYPTSVSSLVYMMGQYPANDYSPVLVAFGAGGFPALAATSAGGTWNIINAVASAAISVNTWSHVAWRRSGNRWSVFINKTEYVLSTTASGTPYDSTASLFIGKTSFSSTYPYSGYLDEFIITKGIALAPSEFAFDNPLSDF